MREIDASDLKIGEVFFYLGERYMRTDGGCAVLCVHVDGPCKGHRFALIGTERVKVDRPVERIALVRVSAEDRYSFDIPRDALVHCFYLDGGNPPLTGRMFDRVLYSPKARKTLDFFTNLKAHTK